MVLWVKLLFCVLWFDFQAGEEENLWAGWRAAPQHLPSPPSIRRAAAMLNPEKILRHQRRERQEPDFLAISRGL